MKYRQIIVQNTVDIEMHLLCMTDEIESSVDHMCIYVNGFMLHREMENQF